MLNYEKIFIKKKLDNASHDRKSKLLQRDGFHLPAKLNWSDDSLERCASGQ